MASFAEMLRYYGYNTMQDFMAEYGLYSLQDAKRMLMTMYEDDTAEEQNR